VHTSTWPGGCSRSRRGPVPTAQAGERKAWGKPQSFVTGCELDDVLAQTDGNIGQRTGLQRARSSHRCFGTCAPHGARAREVHGLPCRMSDVARVMRATCQSLGGDASATQSSCHDRDPTATLRREGRLVADPLHHPAGLTVNEMRVEEEVRVESFSLRKTSDPIADVCERNRDRRHQGAASCTLKVCPSPSDAPGSAG
jgi:hypothetical protein